MRITDAERAAFVEVVESFRNGSAPVELILFGSRADDGARGGDIDLLLVVPAPERARWVAERGRLLAAFKARVGDQRIDLTVATLDLVATDPFFRLSLARHCRLRRWE